MRSDRNETSAIVAEYNIVGASLRRRTNSNDVG
jgi:hypothetical protein